MQKSYNLYHNLGYWFLLLILLVFAGFYVTYFSVLLQPRRAVIHIHFLLMALWIIMLIVQPFFIKFKKIRWHRAVGKFSYVLVPVLLLFAFLTMRYSYYQFLGGQMNKAGGLRDHALLSAAASNQAIAIFYLLWFGIFYVLAVINRKKSLIHSRYMLATALTMLGPTVDRILFFQLHLVRVFGVIPIEAVAFFTADVLLAILFLKDYRSRKPVKTLGICLVIYLAGQVLFFTAPGSGWWTSFVTLIMKPAP